MYLVDSSIQNIKNTKKNAVQKNSGVPLCYEILYMIPRAAHVGLGELVDWQLSRAPATP